jgi:hypothetical protein
MGRYLRNAAVIRGGVAVLAFLLAQTGVSDALTGSEVQAAVADAVLSVVGGVAAIWAALSEPPKPKAG